MKKKKYSHNTLLPKKNSIWLVLCSGHVSSSLWSNNDNDDNDNDDDDDNGGDIGNDGDDDDNDNDE